MDLAAIRRFRRKHQTLVLPLAKDGVESLRKNENLEENVSSRWIGKKRRNSNAKPPETTRTKVTSLDTEQLCPVF